MAVVVAQVASCNSTMWIFTELLVATYSFIIVRKRCHPFAQVFIQKVKAKKWTETPDYDYMNG